MESNWDDYNYDWWKYTLSINTDKGPIKVEWSDANELAKWSNIQAGLYVKGEKSTLQTFYEHMHRWYQWWWDRRSEKGLLGALHDNAKIVDIGSGVAVYDLLLAKYYPNSTFTLVDKEGFHFKKGVYYDKDYPIYNSWSPVIDGIETSGLDMDRFSMQGPDDPWPDEVDAVTSFLSYMWHYPKDLYWDKILDHLKVGGVFTADTRLLVDRDIIGEISEDLKAEPLSLREFGRIPEHIDNMPSPDPEIYGYSAIWIRGK